MSMKFSTVKFFHYTVDVISTEGCVIIEEACHIMLCHAIVIHYNMASFCTELEILHQGIIDDDSAIVLGGIIKGCLKA